MLRGSWNHCCIRSRSEGKYQFVVVHLLTERRPAMAHDHPAPVNVNGFNQHLAEFNIPGAAQGTDRIENMASLDRARCGFGQHRRKEKKVLLADQRDMHW